MANKKKKENRRGKGEGSIYKRADGRWMASISVGYTNSGKQKKKFYYGRTRQEVADKLANTITDVKAGTYIEPSKVKLGDWLDFWFNEYISISIKISTKVSYETYIRGHIKPHLGHVALSSLTTDLIQMFYNEKSRNGRLDKKGGLSPKTIRNMHNMLHEALDKACATNRIKNNPSKGVTLPKRIYNEIRVLTEEEQKRLTYESTKERLGIGIMLVLFSGLRLGELLGLQWKHVDFKNGILSIKQTLNRLKSFDSDTKTKLYLDTPKSLKSRRKIPLHEIMLDELRKYKEKQNEIKEIAGEHYIDEGFIICNDFGKPIEPRTYQDLFYRLVKRANIEKANFHCLRHTFATRALERKVPIKVVSEMLGHSTVVITMDIYSHVLMSLKRESVDKMADLFIPENYKDNNDEDS